MILTANVRLISVNTRSSAVWTSEGLPTLFWVSFQPNQFFSFFSASRNVSSKLETVDAFKQNTGKNIWKIIVSKSVFKKEGAFWPASWLTADDPHELFLKLRAGLNFMVLNCELWHNIQNTWHRWTVNQKTWKNPLHVQRCLLLFSLNIYWDAPIVTFTSLTSFTDHSPHFPFAVCFPISREKLLFDSVQELKYAVLSKMKTSSNFAK